MPQVDLAAYPNAALAREELGDAGVEADAETQAPSGVEVQRDVRVVLRVGEDVGGPDAEVPDRLGQAA
jgi:hypothetical protein